MVRWLTYAETEKWKNDGRWWCINDSKVNVNHGSWCFKIHWKRDHRGTGAPSKPARWRFLDLVPSSALDACAWPDPNPSTATAGSCGYAQLSCWASQGWPSSGQQIWGAAGLSNPFEETKGSRNFDLCDLAKFRTLCPHAEKCEAQRGKEHPGPWGCTDISRAKCSVVKLYWWNASWNKCKHFLVHLRNLGMPKCSKKSKDSKDLTQYLYRRLLWFSKLSMTGSKKPIRRGVVVRAATTLRCTWQVIPLGRTWNSRKKRDLDSEGKNILCN